MAAGTPRTMTTWLSCLLLAGALLLGPLGASALNAFDHSHAAMEWPRAPAGEDGPPSMPDEMIAGRIVTDQAPPPGTFKENASAYRTTCRVCFNEVCYTRGRKCFCRERCLRFGCWGCNGSRGAAAAGSAFG